MKKHLPLLLTFIIFSTISCTFSSKKKQDSLSLELNHWSFKYEDSVYTAEVPGCFHTDLLHHQLIPDPFYRANEDSLQWVGRMKPEYSCTFDIPKEMMEQENISLRFNGVDTYAHISLNNKPLLPKDGDSLLSNMFRVWEFPCKGKLKEKDNHLQVFFLPSEPIDSIKANNYFAQLPDQRAFTRKAAYQNGWDWGPKFVTSGLWKTVELLGWSGFRINSHHFETLNIKEHSAKVLLSLEIESTISEKADIQILLSHKNTIIQKDTCVLLTLGTNQIGIPIDVNNPALWWCNGMGEANLYDVALKISSKRNTESCAFKGGIREIKLVEEPDQYGKGFKFVLNGQDVFIKGANYIPQDNFPARVSQKQYKDLLEMAKSAHMNMLRVWGGGIYEYDIFYELCDEMGIMLWQDFMFACNLYPGDDAFLDNVRIEAEQQIKRLRSHPSLALWCGNNEISEAWYNWGWQKSLNYSPADSAKVWEDYLTLFHKILPSEINKYDSLRSYHPSSPTNGWGRKISLSEGDMHYWGVWWGAEPFEVYLPKTGRFMSEYGFQGFPNYESIKKFTLPEDRQINSAVLAVHQKHPRGKELIQEYMERDFPVPSKFKEYAYMSELLQAYGINIAIEAHRKAKPKCMGTLYWQLNDCWPVISWSGIDYYHNPKALHYAVKRAYRNFLALAEWQNNRLSIYLVSDSTQKISAQLTAKLYDQGKEYMIIDTILDIDPASSKKIACLKGAQLPKFNPATALLVVNVTSGTRSLTQKHFFFQKPKDLKLKKAKLHFDIEQTASAYSIRLRSDGIVNGLFLSTNSISGTFSDNYFSLAPNEEKTILFRSDQKLSIEELRKNISAISLNDILNEK